MSIQEALIEFAGNLATAGATGEVTIILAKRDYSLLEAEVVELLRFAPASSRSRAEGDRLIITPPGSPRITVEAADDVELDFTQQ